MKRALLAVLLAGCAHAPAHPAPQSALLLGADLHAHLVMRDAAAPLFQGRPGDHGPRAESPDDVVENQLDVDELERAGVRVVIASVWPPPAISPWRTPLDQALLQLRALRRWALRQRHVVLARNADEALAASGRGELVLIPAVEGGEGIARVDDVDRLYAAGARSMQLVHFVDNDLAGAASAQLGKALLGASSDDRNPRGLTPLGRAVVQRMLELGMIVDLAHASDRAADDALDLAAAARAPVIDSHARPRALSPGERNVSDALALRIASNGGLVGVTLYRNFLADVPQPQQFEGFVPGTCDEAVAHWLYLAEKVGPEALALGSDLNGFIARPRPGGLCPEGIRGSQDLPALFGALEARGFPRSALDRTGARLLELWKRDELAADPQAQRRAAHANPHPDLAP